MWGEAAANVPSDAAFEAFHIKTRRWDALGRAAALSHAVLA